MLCLHVKLHFHLLLQGLDLDRVLLVVLMDGVLHGNLLGGELLNLGLKLLQTLVRTVHFHSLHGQLCQNGLLKSLFKLMQDIGCWLGDGGCRSEADGLGPWVLLKPRVWAGGVRLATQLNRFGMTDDSGIWLCRQDLGILSCDQYLAVLHGKHRNWWLRHSLNCPHQASWDMMERLKWSTFPASSFQDPSDGFAVRAEGPGATLKGDATARGKIHSIWLCVGEDPLEMGDVNPETKAFA